MRFTPANDRRTSARNGFTARVVASGETDQVASGSNGVRGSGRTGRHQYVVRTPGL